MPKRAEKQPKSRTAIQPHQHQTEASPTSQSLEETQSPSADEFAANTLPMKPDTILRLQALIGNKAVQRVLARRGQSTPELVPKPFASQFGRINRSPEGTDTASKTDPHKTVYQNLFVDAAGTGSTTRTAWTASKEADIIKQVKAKLKQELDSDPVALYLDPKAQTTEDEADKDAIKVDARIHKRFPIISKTFMDKELKDAVAVNPAGHLPNEKFVHDWIANKLSRWSDISKYNIQAGSTEHEALIKKLQKDSDAADFSDARNALVKMLQKLDFSEGMVHAGKFDAAVKDKTWAWVWKKLASKVAAHHEETTGGGSTQRKIFLNPGIKDKERLLTMIHEFVHFYTHEKFDQWVQKTTAPRFYIEGFTEYLARQVMTATERSGRTSYQERVDAIEKEVAKFVSGEDIAAAFFQGEVWRLEGTSDVAKALFKSEIGLDLNGTDRKIEVAESKTSKGIVQIAAPGQHYRFQNLAIGVATPKPEHQAAFANIYKQYIKDETDVKIRFVGHSTASKSKQADMRSAKSRAKAFYKMAQGAGVPAGQLVDAKSPPYKGSSEPYAAETDIYGRALNRRVELFIETTISE